MGKRDRRVLGPGIFAVLWRLYMMGLLPLDNTVWLVSVDPLAYSIFIHDPKGCDGWRTCTSVLHPRVSSGSGSI